MPPQCGGQAEVDHVVNSGRPEVLPEDRQLVVSPPGDHIGHRDRAQVARPGAVVGDRARPDGPVELLVVVLAVRADPDRREEALRMQVELLVRNGVTADEVLHTGNDLDRVGLIELELGDVPEEGEKRLEIGSL